MSTSAPLQDIENIIETRPQLTEQEWEAVGKASDWIKATLRPEIRLELEVEFAKKRSDDLEDLRTQSQAAIREQMEQWKKDQQPLSQDELQKLLSHEYLTFDVEIAVRDSVEKRMTTRRFVITELPQALERKFAECAKRNLVHLIEEAAALEWNIGLPMAKQLQMLLDTIPSALDAAAELAALCLNPWGEEKDVTPEWISQNLSSHRIVAVLIAQSEANHYRDFFSNGFRLFQRRRTA